jgi:hypothetical protein
MKTIKRNIPKVIQNWLEPILDKYKQYVRISSDTKDCIVKIIEADNNSDFYFKILSRTQDGAGTYQTSVEIKPKKEAIISWKKSYSDTYYSKFQNALIEWCDLIVSYQKTSIFDDLLVDYQKEFYQMLVDIKLVDDKDGDVKTFNFQQQIVIDKYLENSLQLLSEHKNNIQQDEYDEIENEIKTARENLGQDTKNVVLKRISTIWAVARHKSFSFGVTIVNLFYEKITEETATLLFNIAKENISKLYPYVVKLLTTTPFAIVSCLISFLK